MPATHPTHPVSPIPCRACRIRAAYSPSGLCPLCLRSRAESTYRALLGQLTRQFAGDTTRAARVATTLTRLRMERLTTSGR